MGILNLKKERLMIFVEDSCPIEDMGIGIKGKLKEYIGNQCGEINLEFKKDLVIIKGNVILTGKGLEKLEIKEIFGEGYKKYIVTGNFFIDGNNLTSLEGCPTEVHGSFSCSGIPL